MLDNPRIEDLRRRVQEDPASIAFAQLAEELRRAGRLEEAVAECRSGLANHPSFVSARVTLGRALLEIGQLEDAQAELETVLGAAPGSFTALRALGEIYQRRSLVPQALAQFRKALALRYDPDLQQTVDELARIAPPTEIAAADSPASARRRTVRQVAALERWLDAIHVARTDRSA